MGQAAADAGASDTIQVRGDSILTEGVEYDFSVELAKKMALATRGADAAPVRVREAVPSFGDSARACLQGDGFTIELAGAPTGEKCSTKPLADSAQRRWVWKVRPVPVSREHGERRKLLFSVESYRNATLDSFTESYAVRVLVVPPTPFERVIAFLTSTKAVLVELVAIAAALAALVKYVRRKRRDDEGEPSE